MSYSNFQLPKPQIFCGVPRCRAAHHKKSKHTQAQSAICEFLGNFPNEPPFAGAIALQNWIRLGWIVFRSSSTSDSEACSISLVIQNHGYYDAGSFNAGLAVTNFRIDADMLLPGVHGCSNPGSSLN